MTSKAFLSAVATMSELSSELRERLTVLADSLTSSERGDTIAKLQSVHSEMKTNRKVAARLYKRGILAMREFEKNVAPRVRSLVVKYGAAS